MKNLPWTKADVAAWTSEFAQKPKTPPMFGLIEAQTVRSLATLYDGPTIVLALRCDDKERTLVLNPVAARQLMLDINAILFREKWVDEDGVMRDPSS